jgi:hypothetical protein
MNKPVTVTFDQMVEHGKASGAPLHNGMAWSFTWLGHPVTHENDQCYLVGNDGMRLTPGNFLVASENGNIVAFAK